MRLSAPIFRLKRQAKLLSRKAGIPLSDALDRVAKEQGYRRWSLLAARYAADSPANKLLAELVPGDLVLLGGRPGHGKTLMALHLILEAIRSGGRGIFFTLEYSEGEVADRLRSLGADPDVIDRMLSIETSEAISADFVIKSLRSVPRGTLVVIDYLQILDQDREKPPLAAQVSALKSFARDSGVTIVFLSQIDRSYDPAVKALPDVTDIRLPNPVDLSCFDKTCFLHDGNMSLERVGKGGPA